MRSLRLKLLGTGVYHCISRSVAGEFLLDGEAKSVFRKMLWEVAEFCGVEVLAYCVMTNHFHVLVRVPKRDEAVLTREEVLRRYAVLYTHSNTPGYPDASALRSIFTGGPEWVVEDWMARLTVRMNDVSEFMKTLKQRFTMWFNKRHQRFGPLWSDRFKSVLVQNDPFVMQTVAAYIDLNPVRAGLAEDPAGYVWSSYGEAMAGATWAQAGLVRALHGRNWPETADIYRRTLFGKAGRVDPERSEKKSELERVVGRSSADADAVEGGPETAQRATKSDAGGGEERENRGMAETDAALADNVLRRRLRALSAGVILGSREFVEDVGAQIRASTEKSEERPGGARFEGEGDRGGAPPVPAGPPRRGSSVWGEEKGASHSGLFCWLRLAKTRRPPPASPPSSTSA